MVGRGIGLDMEFGREYMRLFCLGWKGRVGSRGFCGFFLRIGVFLSF